MERCNKKHEKLCDITQHQLSLAGCIRNLSIGRFGLQLSVDKQNVNHHGSNTVRVVELYLGIAVSYPLATQQLLTHTKRQWQI